MILQLGEGAGRSLLGEITEPPLILGDVIGLILCWKSVQSLGVQIYVLVTALALNMVGSGVTVASDYTRGKLVKIKNGIR